MNKIRITKIKILNFGPFYGEHEIEFPGDETGVYVIHGDTGQGKTSLQRAILWGLYGKALDRNGKEIPFTSLLNISAHKDYNFQFFVIIYFDHEGKSWVITRKTATRFHQEKKYQTAMKLFLVRDGEPLGDNDSERQLEIERILPFDVSRFFFFDGEMLVKYEELLNQDSVSCRQLKSSIERILGIPILRTARDDIDEIKKKLEREQTKLVRRLGGQDYNQLAEDYKLICEEIERTKGLIKSLEDQIDVLGGEVAIKKRTMTELQSVKEKAEKRLSLESEVRGLKFKLDSEKVRLQTLNSKLYKAILSPIVEGAIQRHRLQHERVMGKYTKKTKLQAHVGNIRKAISAQRCEMCGSVLNANKLKDLENELTETQTQIETLTEIPEPNLDYKTWAACLEKIKSHSIDIGEYKRIEEDLANIEHEIAKLETYLKRIEEDLIDVDETEPYKLETQIREGIKEQGRLEREIDILKKQLDSDLSIQSTLKQKLASIDQEELNILAKRIELTEEIHDVFEESIVVFCNERRKEVELKATDIFKKIRSKKDFARLEINENFGLSIITKSGIALNKAEWRSAGEEQIVALALIGALNKCARVDGPVFMDSPFARLDITHGERVITYLPNLSDQVVVSVTDREFRKEDETLLKEKIRAHYLLEHKGEERGSVISNYSV